jgi:hypothetical protein
VVLLDGCINDFGQINVRDSIRSKIVPKKMLQYALDLLPDSSLVDFLAGAVLELSGVCTVYHDTSMPQLVETESEDKPFQQAGSFFKGKLS